jgi:hypothetical protein
MKKRLLPLFMLILITSMSFAQTHTMLVTVPDSIIVCYATGSFNNWNPATSPMTKISDSPKMFSLEFQMADTSADKVEYKFLTGPDWKYQQKASTNFIFKNDSSTAVVDTFLALYNPTQEKDVTIDVLVPIEVYQCNLTGSFNNWDPTANPMELVDSTVNGKEFKVTIHTLDTTTLEFKFIAGPGWPYEQVAGNYNYLRDGGTVVCDEFKSIFDPTKVGDITINIISVPEGTPAVWIIGSFNNWSLETAVQATDNGDGTYTAIIPGVADIEYKCWNYPDWPYEEAKDSAGNGLDANRIASFETGPVFDITVAFWKKVFGVTAINDPISSAYKMYTTNGTIVVEGVKSNVAIFDLYGRLIQNVRANGTFVSTNLRTGLYIVRIDNKAQKIVVR